MTTHDIRLSKKLSWLLRHGATEAGLPMDAAGWVPVGDVLARLRVDRARLEAQVRHNDKRRLQLEGDRIRCCQGHSAETMPVTQEALEASWAPHEGLAVIWHGTHYDAVPGIDAEGLRPGRRTHVHLAEALDSVVGKRARTPVMLAVDPAAMRAAGVPLWRAPNGVILARRVPRAAIVGVVPMSRRAEAARADLEGRFGRYAAAA